MVLPSHMANSTPAPSENNAEKRPHGPFLPRTAIKLNISASSANAAINTMTIVNAFMSLILPVVMN